MHLKAPLQLFVPYLRAHGTARHTAAKAVCCLVETCLLRQRKQQWSRDPAWRSMVQICTQHAVSGMLRSLIHEREASSWSWLSWALGAAAYSLVVGAVMLFGTCLLLFQLPALALRQGSALGCGGLSGICVCASVYQRY